MNPHTGVVIKGAIYEKLPMNAVFAGDFEFDENGKVKMLSGQESIENDDPVICPTCLVELPKVSNSCVRCPACGWKSCGE